MMLHGSFPSSALSRSVCGALLDACRLGAFAALGLVAAAASVGGQEPDAPPAPSAIFEGHVVDSVSGDPIARVMVRMDSGQEAFTDVMGWFRFDDLEAGRRLFAILTADCRVQWGLIDLAPGIPRDVRLRLSPAFAAAAEEAEREDQERRHTGGRRYEAEEIDRMHVHSVTDLIRRVAPGMVGALAGAPGETSAIRSGRSRSFVADDPPVVVIDGMRVPHAEGALHELLASEVAVLEVDPGAAAGWEFGSSGAGGVIKITLRTGVPTGAPERRERVPCVVPTFPRR